jgi:hypothetical protein
MLRPDRIKRFIIWGIIATGYGMDGRSVGVRVQIGARCFSVHVVHTGFGAHSDPYSLGAGGGLSSEVKRPGCQADQSPPISTEVKNTWM